MFCESDLSLQKRHLYLQKREKINNWQGFSTVSSPPPQEVPRTLVLSMSSASSLSSFFFLYTPHTFCTHPHLAPAEDWQTLGHPPGFLTGWWTPFSPAAHPSRCRSSDWSWHKPSRGCCILLCMHRGLRKAEVWRMWLLPTIQRKQIGNFSRWENKDVSVKQWAPWGEEQRHGLGYVKSLWDNLSKCL